MNIDPQTQEYYDDYLDLFLHPGWKRFMEDLQGSLINDQQSAVSRCDTSEAWFTERGAQGKTQRILNFETLIRNQYDELRNEAEEALDNEDPE